MVPVLDKARIEKVQRDGILITGPEVIPTTLGIKNIKADHFRQSGYCIPEARPFDHQAAADDWRSDDAEQWTERYLKQSEE